MNMKQKLLTAATALFCLAGSVNAAAYVGNYTEDDFVPILFDGLGTGGVFVVSKISTIGSILLVLFVLGSVTVIVRKARGIVTV